MSSHILERAALSALVSALAGVAGVLYAASRSRPGIPGAAPPLPPHGLPPARLVPVPGRGEIFVREGGYPAASGQPTIALLHGWACPADIAWCGCYEPLSRIGRVVAMDHRGHGRSSRPSEPFRLVDAADDVAALLRELGASPVIAVGYSMGGTIAQLLWRRHPDLVRGLVLCATAATFAEGPRDRLLWRGMGALQVALRVVPRFWWERLLRAQLEGTLPFRLTRLITSDTPPETVQLLPWIIGELDRSSAEDMAEAGRELGRYDARGWLGGVDVPTAVVVTTRDQLVPVERQRAMAALIPGAQTFDVDLDHDAPSSRPDLFVATLEKALGYVRDA
ncbi:MAG: alpha/beta fold hydrolase [Egibacteraceae bacterium]